MAPPAIYLTIRANPRKLYTSKELTREWEGYSIAKTLIQTKAKEVTLAGRARKLAVAKLAGALCALLVGVVPASASLIGQTVTLCTDLRNQTDIGQPPLLTGATTDLANCFSTSADPFNGGVAGTAIVDALDVEFSGIGTFQGGRDIDIDAEGVTYTRSTSTDDQATDFFLLTGLSWFDEANEQIVGFTIVGDNDLNIELAFDQTSLGLFIPNDSINGTVRIEFETAAAVPLPASVLLLGGALGLLAVGRRRSRPIDS